MGVSPVSPRKTPEMNPTCAEELGRRSPSAKWPPEIAERFEAKWRAMKQQRKDFVATSWDLWKILAVKQGKTAHGTSIEFGKSQTPQRREASLRNIGQI